MLYPKHGDPRAHRNWTCNLQYKTVGGCNSYCTKRMVEILSWDNPAINWCRISQPCSLSDSSIVSPAPAVIHNSLRTSWLFEGYMDWSKYVRMHIIHIYIYINTHIYIYKYTCIYIYICIYMQIMIIPVKWTYWQATPSFGQTHIPMIHWSTPCFEW